MKPTFDEKRHPFLWRFYPYVPFHEALPAPSQTLEFLQGEQGPFRIAPFFPYLYPNTSELFRLEDIRSHWGAEKAYRELMHRIDPTALDLSTVVLFNRQIVFLDRLAANIRAQSGAAISRAQLIRALLDAVADADVDLTTARSESDLKTTILSRLGKYRM